MGTTQMGGDRDSIGVGVGCVNGGEGGRKKGEGRAGVQVRQWGFLLFFKHLFIDFSMT